MNKRLERKRQLRKMKLTEIKSLASTNGISHKTPSGMDRGFTTLINMIIKAEKEVEVKS